MFWYFLEDSRVYFFELLWKTWGAGPGKLCWEDSGAHADQCAGCSGFTLGMRQIYDYLCKAWWNHTYIYIYIGHSAIFHPSPGGTTRSDRWDSAHAQPRRAKAGGELSHMVGSHFFGGFSGSVFPHTLDPQQNKEESFCKCYFLTFLEVSQLEFFELLWNIWGAGKLCWEDSGAHASQSAGCKGFTLGMRQINDYLYM